MEFTVLDTDRGTALTGTPWPEYPRPSLRRDSFVNLNGEWDFAVGDPAQLPEHFDRTIRVPFPPESKLSGIGQVFPEEQALYYRKNFTLPEEFVGRRVLLHFGAVDQEAAVFLNGKELGTHIGGYQAFSYEITDALERENTLLVRVRDRLSQRILPYGKQTRKRGGMWYTPVSGIWQTVWMEAVGENYIRSIQTETGENWARLYLEGITDGQATVRTPNGDLNLTISDGMLEVQLDRPRLWCPEDPYLYEVHVETAEDRIDTYFALRALETKLVRGFPRLCLNGKPYFFHGVLDQGYWSDGLFTPASPACFEDDILAMKRLGFNTLRKHIKIEPELFYYACDRLGMVVFQDMVNNGPYRYIRDTVLPTLGFQKKDDRRLHRDPVTRRQFRLAMEQTVEQLRKHPCICYWTIFNEGWGQFDSQREYEFLKTLDDTRFVDTASGWFRWGDSDVESLHIYFHPIRLLKSQRPQVLSEFGGYVYKEKSHSFNRNKTYGYKLFDRQEDFMDALERLYREGVLEAKKKGLSAAIYTQLSDVEDETNGLMTYDRKICKVDETRMNLLSRALREE